MLLDYPDFLGKLGCASLSVRAFAGLICMNPNSVFNYTRSGEVPTYLALIVVLVAELRSRRIDYKPIVARAALIGKKPQSRAKHGWFGSDRQNLLDLDQ